MTTSSRGEMVDLDVVRSALATEFEIVEEIGRGGMAIVFRAIERGLDREVALKVLPFSLAFDADFVERFQREARTAGRLEHPHIVPIYRVGRSGSVIYFTMQLLRGQSLSERLRERGRLSVPEIRRVLIETASALGHAAKHGIVHRDVKPDNILLDQDGRCVVTDFGIARSAADQRLTATGMSVGTPRYMSPEQARARELDGRSDLYSLGIVAYECLAGGTPFEGSDAFAILMDHINAPLPRPPLRDESERALFAVIERLLAKLPDDRFQTADELIAALAGVPGTAGAVAQRGGEATVPGLNAAALAANGAAPARRSVPLTPTRAAAAVTGWPSAKPRSASGTDRVRAQLGRLRSKGPRFWGIAAGTVALVVGGYYGVHFATMHSTRCPAALPPDASALLANGSANPGSASVDPLLLLVDPVSRHHAGSGLDVYYDVCGLEDGAAFTARVTVRRAGFALPGMRGRTVEQAFDDRADAQGSRRHRTLDVGDLPAGAYTLGVELTDARGRSRTRRLDIQFTE